MSGDGPSVYPTRRLNTFPSARVSSEIQLPALNLTTPTCSRYPSQLLTQLISTTLSLRDRQESTGTSLIRHAALPNDLAHHRAGLDHRRDSTQHPTQGALEGMLPRNAA